jgi:hypothetical protein
MSRKEGQRLLAAVEARPHLRMAPRLVVVKELPGADLACAGVFVAPVDPGHVARALQALYPRSAATPPEGGWPRPERDWSRQIADALAG